MAFNTNNQNSSNDTSWKADAFLNIYVQVGESKRKVGAITLKNSKSYEAALIKRLQEPGALEAMQAKMVLDFQLANVETPVAALGF